MPPIRSRQASTNRVGERLPCALILSMMSLTPDLFASEKRSTAKLMRLTSPAVLIHSVPVCQPSTLGGSRMFCPMKFA